MRAELQNGDEQKNQYVLLAWETPEELRFLTDLRSWWNQQDR